MDGAAIGSNWMPRKKNLSGLALDNNSARLRKKALMVCGQSVTPMVKVQDLGVFIDQELTRVQETRQWSFMWSILYVAACTNSANFAASSSRWPSTAGAHLLQHLLLVASTTAMVSYTVSQKEKLSNFLNAAARLVVGTGKFSHVTTILHNVLHCLPVQHWISYKIAILARDYIHGIGPAYFDDICIRWLQPLDEPTCVQQHVAIFWSLKRRTKLGKTEFPYICTDGVELTSIFAQTFSYKPQTFSEKNWRHHVRNSLPDDLRNPELSIGSFRNILKTLFFPNLMHHTSWFSCTFIIFSFSWFNFIHSLPCVQMGYFISKCVRNVLIDWLIDWRAYAPASENLHGNL